MNPIVKALNFVRSYTMRPPKWITYVIVAIIFLVPGYWAVTESGPFFTISSWQADIMHGDYYPALSYLLIVLGLLFSAIPVLILIGLFFPEKHPDETDIRKNLF